MVVTVCPKCSKSYNVKDQYAGMKVRCAKCRHVFFAPEKETPEAQPEAVTPASEVAAAVGTVGATAVVATLANEADAESGTAVTENTNGVEESGHSEGGEEANVAEAAKMEEVDAESKVAEDEETNADKVDIGDVPADTADSDAEGMEASIASETSEVAEAVNESETEMESESAAESTDIEANETAEALEESADVDMESWMAEEPKTHSESEGETPMEIVETDEAVESDGMIAGGDVETVAAETAEKETTEDETSQEVATVTEQDAVETLDATISGTVEPSDEMEAEPEGSSETEMAEVPEGAADAEGNPETETATEDQSGPHQESAEDENATNGSDVLEIPSEDLDSTTETTEGGTQDAILENTETKGAESGTTPSNAGWLARFLGKFKKGEPVAAAEPVEPVEEVGTSAEPITESNEAVGIVGIADENALAEPENGTLPEFASEPESPTEAAGTEITGEDVENILSISELTEKSGLVASVTGAEGDQMETDLPTATESDSVTEPSATTEPSTPEEPGKSEPSKFRNFFSKFMSDRR